MTDQDRSTNRLDSLLQEAARSRDDVPAALTSRVLADAARVQSERPVAPGPVRRRRSFSWLPGGWQGLGGLVAATCAGFWIGVSPPDLLPDTGAVLLGYDVSETAGFAGGADGFGWDAEEG